MIFCLLLFLIFIIEPSLAQPELCVKRIQITLSSSLFHPDFLIINFSVNPISKELIEGYLRCAKEMYTIYYLLFPKGSNHHYEGKDISKTISHKLNSALRIISPKLRKTFQYDPFIIGELFKLLRIQPFFFRYCNQSSSNTESQVMILL